MLGNRPDRPGTRAIEQIVVEVVIRLGFLFLLVYVALALIRPFAPLLMWSVILTVATYPIFEWLSARLGGRRSAAAALMTVVSLAVVFGPAAILSTSLIISLEKLAVGFAHGDVQLGAAPAVLTNLPVIGDDLRQAWTDLGLHAAAFVRTHANALLLPSEFLLRVIAELAGSILVFALSVVISGFLLLSGPALVGWLRDFALRVVGERGSAFVGLTGATIRNVARGVVGISVLQALVLGVGLIVAGVPHAGLLTVATLIFGIVQLGAITVMLPVIVWFWLTHDPLTAALFSAYMAPAALVDHLLKPIVMSTGVATPMLVIALGVASGTLVYGLLGLFIGPIVLAVLHELVIYWMRVESPRHGEEHSG